MLFPKPKTIDTEDAFVKRCMRNKNMISEFPDTNRRKAVASSLFNTNPTDGMEMSLSFNKDDEQSPKLLGLRHLMSDLVKVQKLDDKDFLVIPTVMILEGVHNNVYYPSEELSKFPASWDGRPVVLAESGHPTDDNGNNISANTPEGFQHETVGYLFNTKWNKDENKLVSEVWIDILKCKEVNQDLLDKLNNNEDIEVSTGLFTECDMEAGEWNGETFIGTVFNYRPDHLALLPNDIGACSWEDGAGMCRNKQEGDKVDEKKLKELEAFNRRSLHINELSHDGIRMELSEVIRSKVNPAAGDFVWVMDVFDKTFVYEHQTNQDTKIFKQGYSVTADDKVELSGDSIEVERKIEFVPVTNIDKPGDATDQGDATNKGGSVMSRPDEVKALIANSDWSEEDVELFTNMSDDAFARVKAGAEKLQGNEEEAKDESKDETKEESKDEAKDETKDEKEEVPVTNKVVTVEDFLTNAPDEIRESIQLSLDRDKQIKANMVSDLLANKGCPYSQEELDGMKINELDKLLKFAGSTKTVSDYSAQTPAAITDNVDESLTVPDMVVLSAKKEDK